MSDDTDYALRYLVECEQRRLGRERGRWISDLLLILLAFGLFALVIFLRGQP